MYPQIFGKYVLERELARGGMARVLLATLRGAGGFEKKLVVKQIREELAHDPEFLRRFVEEAKTTVALSHPNIVPVYELGVEGGVYFLAMEFVQGVSVAELLADGGALSPDEGAYLGIEICRALDYAHRRMNIVHRDITPRNVMVDDEGQIKLIDFGIAAPARAGQKIFGSPGHMPPEQMNGESISPATDLFAVAVLLMEAWSATAPFRRKTPLECEEALRGPHPRPGEVNARLIPLDEVIGRTMSLDPAQRPQEAEELSRVLRRYLQDVDLGDVARSLGKRAETARLAAQARGLPEAPAEEGTRKVSETKTFAASEEVRRWSSRPPTGIEAIETVATRPIETPVERPAKEIHDGRARSGHRRWLVVAAPLAALLVVLAQRHLTSRVAAPSVTTAPTDSGGTRIADSAFAPAASSAPPTPAAAEPSASAAPSVQPAPSPATASAPRSTSLASFFADPETHVSIDGIPRGRCPQRDLPLEPGSHTVRFSFAPTGESADGRFDVPAGGRVRVLADFTGAAPTMRVEPLPPRQR